MIEVENQILTGDCLELLSQLSANCVDLVLTDLPYGCTQNVWDKVIDPPTLWAEYRRILKPHGAVVMTAQGLFSARMMLAAPDLYKYSLIWKKNKSRGFLNAKKQPLRAHEDILVFYAKQCTYNPQKSTGHTPVHAYTKHTTDGTNYGATKQGIQGGGSTERYPTSILEIPVLNNDSEERINPTQKPLALGEYLVKTYSNPGDLVLDNACGSGTFPLAAKRLGRRWIGMESDSKMAANAKERLHEAAAGQNEAV